MYKRQAYDFVGKPVDFDELQVAIRNALEATSLRTEVQALRGAVRGGVGYDSVVSVSSKMTELMNFVRKVASSEATTILIQGESGTGKDLIAKAIHYELSLIHIFPATEEGSMSRVAKIEQQPAAATGTTLVVMVGLGVAFLLFMAFLNVVKSGNLLNDSNLLYAALIFYCGAGTLYLAFGITGLPSYIRYASLATWAGLIANTGAVARRWYEAGHPPFASIYEMLLMFVWTLAVLTLIAEKKYGVKIIGTVTMPVAIVGVILMQLLRTEVRPLAVSYTHLSDLSPTIPAVPKHAADGTSGS